MTHLDDAVSAILTTIDAHADTRRLEQERRAAIRAMRDDDHLTVAAIRTALLAELEARGVTDVAGLGVSVAAIRDAVEHPPPPE